MRYPQSTKQEALARIELGDSNLEISEDLGVSVRTLQVWRKNAPSGGSDIVSDPEHISPNFFDFLKEKDKKPMVLDTLDALVERTEGHNDRIKDYRRIAIETDKPVAVMSAGDLHMGGLDISYRSLAEHYRFLLDTDNFYLRLLGDELNLMIMHRVTGARHDILSPNEQMELFSSMVNELMSKGKLLWVCSGNHTDEFTERSAGFGLVKHLTSGKVPYFRGLGYVDLEIGDQTYPVAFAHKTRFSSFMNQTHGNKRILQQHHEYFPGRAIAREIITAHTHNPAVSFEGMTPEERIYFIKVGTFKTNDVYSQRYFGQGRIGVPTTVYRPDRFEHVVFPTPYEAATYIRGLTA